MAEETITYPIDNKRAYLDRLGLSTYNSKIKEHVSTTISEEAALLNESIDSLENTVANLSATITELPKKVISSISLNSSSTSSITSKNGVLNLTAGTNISLAEESNGVTITNTYVLPKAAADVLGGVKVGENLTFADDGTLSLTKNNVTGALGFTPLGASTKYAASSTVGGSANSAEKLNTNAGSLTQPIYFENGVPVATTYALNKTVPASAEFTDTKVTSAENHYTPEEYDALNSDASSSTSASWGSTALVTGVNIGKDEKGHITSLSVDSIKLPANPNTWRSVKVGNDTLSDTTTPLTVTGSGATSVSLSGGTLTIDSTDTKYIGNSPITVNDTTITHNTSGVTEGTANEGGSNRTLVHGESFNVPSLTVDKYGHVTSRSTTTLTLPADTNTWRPITVGETSIEGNDLTLTAGTNVTLGVTEGKVTINSKCANTEYTFSAGSSNGTFTVTPSNGSAQSVAIKGLGSLAYKNSLSASEVDALPEDTTYVQSITKSGNTITVTPSVGESFTFTSAINSKATTSTDGLMSSTDKAKLDGIDEGAEVNVIETVKVNGTALTPSNKAVNVTVPTKVSQLTDASSYAKTATTLSGYGITDAKIDTTTNKITLGENSIVPLTSHQDISGKENTSNKVSTWSATTSNIKYPSEKLVKDSLDAKSNTGHTHTKSEITDFPTLASVATSGSYNDLSNKPSIPTVDSTLDSTSANAIQNKAVKSALDGKANSSHTHTKSQITDFPTLAGVATSGSYADLSNKPSIPTVDSELDADSTNAIQNSAVKSALDGKANSSHTHTIANITSLQTTLDSKAGKATTLSGYGITDAKIADGVITLGSNTIIPLTSHQNISGKADKATTLSGYGITNAYTKDEIDTKLASSMKYKGQKDTYSDLPKTSNSTGDVWDVKADGHNYAWNGTSWDDLGGTVDLSGYYDKTTADTLLGKKADKATTLSGYGITDAKISSGTITLGSNSITPLTSHQDISGKADKATTLSGYGITDAKISNGVITLGSNTITPLTSHQNISGKEDASNKVSSWSTTTSNTKYPSEKLVKDSLDGKANTSHTHTISNITDFPTLADVATSGSYGDLTGTPSTATSSANGLMSSTDKSNLDTINGSYIKSASVSGQTLTITDQSGKTYSVTNTNTNTWRNVKVNGASSNSLGTGTDTGALNFLNGTNTTASYDTTNKGVKYNIAVTNEGATLSYGNTSKIATVGSADINVTMPAQYSHPAYTSKTSGLYKITVDSMGHVSGTTAVAKSDITALGIPASNTDTWRPITVGGTTDSTSSLTVKSSGSASVTLSNGVLTIGATDTKYTHPTYNTATSGLYNIVVNNLGHVTATTKVTKEDITALGIPSADTNTWREIKVDGTSKIGSSSSTALNFTAGDNVDIAYDSGTLTVSATDTTYNSGTGITVSGTTINHSNSITAGTASGTDGKVSHGGTVSIPSISYDAQGHITSVGSTSVTLPSDSNTWRNVTVNGISALGTGTSSGVLTFATGSTDGTIAVAGKDVSVKNLKAIATSGSYNDLSDTPTIDSSLSATSTNALQNKAINTALSNKADKIHAHAISDITNLQTTLNSKANSSTTLAGYGISNAYTKDEIDTKLASSMTYMGQKDTYNDLPASGNSKGDVWNVSADDHNYAWDGSAWDDLGGTVDLSAYYTSSAIDTLLAKKAGTSTFSSTADGLVPKSGSTSTTTFLNANGSWAQAVTNQTSSGTGNAVTSISISGDTLTWTKGSFAGTSTFSTTANGLVPAATGTSDTSKFLKGDGTWATPTNTNTTYTFASGSIKGNFSVTPSGGTAQSVAIYGLSDLAYIGKSTASNKASQFLNGNGAWAVPTNTTYSFAEGTTNGAFNVTPSGSTSATSVKVHGLGSLAYLSNGTNTTTYLRNDGSWAVPTDTTYTNGEGLSLSGTTFSHYTPTTNEDSKLSAAAKVIESTESAGWGTTAFVSGVTLSRDTLGHVTGVSVNSIKMPSNPNTDTNYYPTEFAWTAGTESGPTGSLTVSGTTGADVTFGAIPSASASTSGVVTTNAQTFAGVKTFSNTTDADSTGAGAVIVSGGIYASKKIYSATGVFNAVWNDLADCIPVDEDCTPEAGYCYCFDGTHYYKSNKYRANGIIGINSDTYGMNMGRKPNTKQMDIAVSGFVLAYVDKEYRSGTPLTCTKDGKLTKIRLIDRILHPHKIVATYWKSEPNEEWGSETRKVKVNGRKWVKIR